MNHDGVLRELAGSLNTLTSQHRELLRCLQTLQATPRPSAPAARVLKHDYDYFADLDMRLSRLRGTPGTG